MRAFALFCGNAEPSLSELLNDPIMRLLLERDGLTPDDVREVVATAARRQCQNRHQGGPAPWLPALEAQKA